jgi:hypothetical protein
MNHAFMPPRRAFVLMELIALLAVFAAFAIVSGELLRLCNRAQQNALRRTALITRVDSAVGALRRDFWAASAASVASDGTLTLTVDDRPIRWNAAALPAPVLPSQEFRIQRQAGPDRFAWTGVPATRFALAGPLLTLTFGEGETAESLTLTGPLLAGGAR